MKNVRLFMAVCAMLALLAGAAVYGSNFHGAMPPPDDGTGTVIMSQHGAMPPPDDGTGTLLMAQHGAMPPPDDGTGTFIG